MHLIGGHVWSREYGDSYILLHRFALEYEDTRFDVSTHASGSTPRIVDSCIHHHYQSKGL